MWRVGKGQQERLTASWLRMLIFPTWKGTLKDNMHIYIYLDEGGYMASAPQKLQGLEYLALNLQFVLDVRKTALNSATLHT